MERALAISAVQLVPQPDEQHPLISSKDISLEAEISSSKLSNPDPADVERRRALLRTQRDKILNKKHKEHEQQLKLQSSQILRPKSGLAARQALDGTSTQVVDERTIQYRRLLLNKIKEQVEGPAN